MKFFRSAMMTLSVPPRTRSLSPGVSRSSPSSPMSRPAHDREMRARSGSLTLQRRTEIALCPQLTSSQVTALRKSWRHINTKGLITVLSRVFQRLESSCPAASRCFASQPVTNAPGCVRTVGEHARCMLQVLDKIIEGEQDEDEIREMGARHAVLQREFGLAVTDVDRLQEIFVDVMLKLDGIKQSKETSRAWRLLICEVVNLFRAGYDTQLRQFRRKHSFNAHTQYFERRASLSARKASLNGDPRRNLTDF